MKKILVITTIALFSVMAFSPVALASFDSLFGIPAPPSFTILCPTGGCPAFSPNNSHGPVGWAFETSLDVEYAHAMAPGANIVLAVASTNSGNAINNIEAQAISLY